MANEQETPHSHDWRPAYGTLTRVTYRCWDCGAEYTQKIASHLPNQQKVKIKPKEETDG